MSPTHPYPDSNAQEDDQYNSKPSLNKGNKKFQVLKNKQVNLDLSNVGVGLKKLKQKQKKSYSVKKQLMHYSG